MSYTIKLNTMKKKLNSFLHFFMLRYKQLRCKHKNVIEVMFSYNWIIRECKDCGLEDFGDKGKKYEDFKLKLKAES